MNTTGKQIRAILLKLDADQGKKVFEDHSTAWLAGVASAIEDRFGPERAADECYKLADRWASKTAGIDILAPQKREPPDSSEPMLKGTTRKKGSIKFESPAKIRNKRDWDICYGAFAAAVFIRVLEPFL